ncbi:sigma-54 interaction domain-containing protein [Clostridium aminobutyricum]|uniref:Sigma 54-interacting transcriptional regulator n=1 Tax=Clostridium aminobutyricum TaxID=33953 RepID=A0A939IGN1_CLOAM|nr:sigma 54-interacting transcriptional regulator [Clostridium aminobutyricum]MBN7773575.1 sigma 54-interacting transcriptional regulator [Clostridium aminobutyricum]
MDNIQIQSINLPVLIYNYENKKIYSNAHADVLFNSTLSLEKFQIFITDIITSNDISTSFYKIMAINEEEYLVTFIKTTEDFNYLITIENSKSLNTALRESTIIKDLELEFYNILGAMHDDFVIIDKDGVLVTVLPNFEYMYGISNEEAIGKTVYEMEERKIFSPSVAIRVFKSGMPETMLQLTGANKYLMCTAIPIKDENNNIIKIVSYTTDVTKYQTLKDEYNKLEETLKIYTAELEQLRQGLGSFPSVIGNSHSIKSIISTVDKISKFDANVLFTGESGVGKTMFAKLMHAQSSRQKGPFIEINCGAIPDSLMESELFGYEKGAFTGANKEGKPGLIELSNNGTLFLDEIGDLPLHMQVKLLKVIQEKKITRVGSVNEKEVDFRLITATNKDLEEMIIQGKFREDLFYRLNVISISIPSLRERKEDIFLLSKYFIEKFNQQYNITRTLSNIAIDYLIEYSWPGNLRELENTIERLVLTSDNYMITEEDLPSAIKLHMFSNPISNNKSLKSLLQAVEEKAIIECYKKHGTSIGVAKELGISQPSASIKINKYISKH